MVREVLLTSRNFRALSYIRRVKGKQVLVIILFWPRDAIRRQRAGLKSIGGMYLRAISQEKFEPSITKFSLKIAYVLSIKIPQVPMLYHKVCGVIIYPFFNFNDCTIKVWECQK